MRRASALMQRPSALMRRHGVNELQPTRELQLQLRMQTQTRTQLQMMQMMQTMQTKAWTAACCPSRCLGVGGQAASEVASCRRRPRRCASKAMLQMERLPLRASPLACLLVSPRACCPASALACCPGSAALLCQPLQPEMLTASNSPRQL